METKGFQGQRIDSPMWKFTRMVAKHYNHASKMKKHRCIKNKDVEHIVKANVEKATLIPTPLSPMGCMILMKLVMHGCAGQQCPNVTYKVSLLFTKYVSYTCEWVLCENLCKHQVVILLMCIDFTKENIIQYYGTCYGSNREGFQTLYIYTFIIMSPMMKSLMKRTLKNHGLSTWVNF